MPASVRQAADMVRDVRWGRAEGLGRGLKHSGPEIGSPATGATGSATERATAGRHMSVMCPIPAYSRMSPNSGHGRRFVRKGASGGHH